MPPILIFFAFLAALFVIMRRRHQRAKREDLLDWAETLLCNVEPPAHTKPEEWRAVLRTWRDQKHDCD